MSSEILKPSSIVATSWDNYFPDSHSYSSQFKIRNVASVVEEKNLTRDDLKTHEKRMQFDRWLRGGEFTLDKVVMKWIAKKEKEVGITITPQQGILRFLTGNEYQKLVKEEKIPVEFKSCKVPNYVDKGEHYYIDGTPIPGHTRKDLERLISLHPEVDMDTLPKVYRLNGYSCKNFLAPYNSKNEPFSMEASKCACQWWKLAYSGQMPADTFDYFFNQDTITFQNKGFVREELVNLQANLAIVEKTFSWKTIWPYFHPQCVKFIVDKMDLDLTPNSEADEYENLCAHSFGKEHTVEEVPPLRQFDVGKIVEIEETDDDDELLIVPKVEYEIKRFEVQEQILQEISEETASVPLFKAEPVVVKTVGQLKVDPLNFCPEDDDCKYGLWMRHILPRFQIWPEVVLPKEPLPKQCKKQEVKEEKVVVESLSGYPLKHGSRMYDNYGKKLYRRISHICGLRSQKIIGMFLDMPFPQVKKLLYDEEYLYERMMQAACILRSNYVSSRVWALMHPKRGEDIVEFPLIKSQEFLNSKFVDSYQNACNAHTNAQPVVEESVPSHRDQSTQVFPDSITPIRSIGVQTDSVVFAEDVDWEDYPLVEEDSEYEEDDYNLQLSSQEKLDAFEELPLFPEVESSDVPISALRVINWAADVLHMSLQEFSTQVLPSWPEYLHESLLQEWMNQKERQRQYMFMHFRTAGVPGLNGGADTEEANDSVTIQEANITFVDERVTEETGTHDGGSVSNREVYSNMSETPWELREMLERPILLGQYDWLSADREEIIASLPIPGELLGKDTERFNISVMRSFSFYRTDVEIRIQLNGTKFHNGRLLAFIVPPLWNHDEDYYSFDNISCWPHVFLDACLNDSAVIHVPFIHMLSHFCTVSAACQDDSMFTLGRVILVVWNKLRYGSGASSKLTVSIWGRLVNPQLHMTQEVTDITVSQGLFIGGVNAGVPTTEAGDFFGSMVNATGRGLGSAIAGGISSLFTGGLDLGIGDMISGLIGGTLYDKPRNVDLPNQIVNMSAYAPCHGAGIDNSVRLALTNISVSLTKPDQIGSSSPDMQIKKLLSIPSMIKRIEWNSSSESATWVTGFPICPSYLTDDQMAKTGDHAVYSPSMLAYISRAFCYWRGSIVFKFQVISTLYHAGRLAFVYRPALSHHDGDQEIDIVSNYNSLVYDIEEFKEFEIEIPFVSIRPWLRCDSFRHAGNFNAQSNTEQDSIGTSFTGFLDMFILNRLVAPANVSQVVDINVYVRAGDDFELAVPNALTPLNITDKEQVQYGGISTYPFTKSKDQVFGPAQNKEWIVSTFYEGYALYKMGLIADGKTYWYEATRKSDKYTVSEEVNSWLYKTQQLYYYPVQFDKFKDYQAETEFMNAMGKYEDFKPSASIEAGETMLSGRQNDVPTACILKNARKVAVAPYTVSENAMNLQTVMRRYYPLVNSFEMRNVVGYTIVQIPVTPTLCPMVRLPIGRYFAEPVPIHHIAWFARLFTWWRGSLRYMLTFNDAAPDIAIVHVPTEAAPFSVITGASEIEIQRLMSFAGSLNVTHVGGSQMVEVPFFSTYNMLLMDSHNKKVDLRAQNGTLYIMMRNRYSISKPVSFTLLMSCGEDFVMDILKAPPRVFEWSEYISTCTRDGGGHPDAVRLNYPEVNRSVTDTPKRILTPLNCGYRWYQATEDNTKNIVAPGYCIPFIPDGGFTDMPEVEAISDMILPAETRMKMNELMNSTHETMQVMQQCALNMTAIVSQVKEEKTVEELTASVKSVNSMLARFQEAPIPTQESTLSTYTRMSCEVVAIGGVLINLRRVIEEPCIANFVTLGMCLCALFSLIGTQMVTGLIESIVGWLFKTSGNGPREVESGPIDVFENHEGSILTCVAIFGTIMYASIFGAIPSWKKIKKALKEFFESEVEICSGTTPEVESGWLNLKEVHFSVLGMTALEKVFNKIYDLVGRFINWILDRESPEYASARIALEYKDRLFNIIKEVDELDDENMLMQALKDPFVNNRFYRLQDESRALMDVCVSDSKVSQRLYQTLSRYNTKVERLVTLLQKNEPPNSRRYEPYCLCLHGNPGCGKSEIMTDFSELIADVMKLPKHNRIYPKNISDRFWSGYKQQPIVQWDEFAQNRDADCVVPEFVTLKSCQPAMVNMADVKEKGRYFTSQAIVMATNVAYAHIDTLRDPNAYLRRRNVIVGFKLKSPHTALSMAERKHREFPEFEHVQFSILDQYQNKPIDDAHADLNFSQVKDFVRRSVESWHNKQVVAMQGSQPCALPRGITVVNRAPPVPAPLSTQAMRDLLADFNEREEEAEYEEEEDETPKVEADDQDAPIISTRPVVFAPYKHVSSGSVYYDLGNEGYDVAFKTFLASRNIEVAFQADSSIVDLTEEEQDERDYFLEDPSIYSKCRAVMVTTVEKIKTSSAYSLCSRFMAKCDDVVQSFYTSHPMLFKIMGTLGLLMSVAGVAHAFGSKPYEQSAYSATGSTHFSHRVKPIVNAAYDSNPKNKSSHRVLASIESSSDPCAADIQAKIQRSVYILSWLSGQTRMLRCFQLCGTLILVPKHFFASREKGDIFFLAHRVVNVYVEYDPSRLRCEENQDWCLYDCGLVLEPGKHLQKYFISEENLHKVKMMDCCLATISEYMIHESYFGQCEAVRHYAYNDSKYGDTYVQTGWKYRNMATNVGHCGSPLVGYSTMLPTPGKIVGFHVAGYQRKNEGFSVLITREMLERQIARFEKQLSDIPKIEAIDITRDVLKDARIKPCGDYSLVGVVPNSLCLHQPLKTCFRETPWIDEMKEEAPKIPAQLRPFVNSTGERKSPLAIALQKYGKEIRPFPQKNLKKVEAFVTNLFETKLVQHTGKRIFTETEAILGIEGLPFCERINMKSSPGWPYQIYDKRNPGKWHLFDEEGNVCNDFLRYMLDSRLEAAKKLERVPSVWRDCLKDELRPPAKVDAGKTRLFTIAPVDFTILIRRYFLDFVTAFYNANTDNFFSAVGITPESMEWTRLYQYLSEKSSQCVAGDFRNFDGCIHPDLIEMFVNCVNNWYNDGEDNAAVRKVLILEIIHTCHLVENLVYMSHKGNPSGNPLTAVLNTVVNYFIMLLIFLEIYPGSTLQDFLDLIRFIAYGDDHLFTVPDKFRDFNFNNIQKKLLNYGIEYTTDKKEVENAPDFIPLMEATFLKRGFRKDPEFGASFMVPTMSKDTINSFFYYYRVSDDVQEQLQENMRACLSFAAFHGRAYYAAILKQWQVLMRKVKLEPLHISFEEQMDVFHAFVGFVKPDSQEPIVLSKRQKGKCEGMDKFMKATNSRLARTLCAFVEAPLYYACAAVGLQSKDENIERTDDRWAVSIPSGEGKSTLCRDFPHIFVDHDDLLIPEFSLTPKQILSKGLPWTAANARTHDYPVEDRRILLVHSVNNTKRQIIGSYITHFPTFIRTNILGRLQQRKAIRMSRSTRNTMLLSVARDLEPALFSIKPG